MSNNQSSIRRTSVQTQYHINGMTIIVPPGARVVPHELKSGETNENTFLVLLAPLEGLTVEQRRTMNGECPIAFRWETECYPI